jgi:NAD(P)-dependent dehydrogenase (short-subunit alcohol dehydrogenase family)
MSAKGKLQGKKSLVTGAATGIGREIALEFARQGSDVILHYNHHFEGANSAVAEIQAMGRRAAAFKADFDSAEAAVSVGEEAIGFLGSIDCLVNNAGITFNKPFSKITPAQFDRLFHVNLRAQFFLTQHIVDHIIGKGGTGAVCNLTSIHGLQGAPEHSLYAATKGAIIGYTRSLAVELAHRGIRVNAIAPGWVMVENHFAAVPGLNEKDAADRARNKVPAGRYGVPLDIARLAAFLCSPDADFIVGQTIVSDGGSTALMSLLTDFRTESAAQFGKDYMAGL